MPQQENPASDASPAQSVRKELHWLEVLNFIGQIILSAVGIIAVCIYGKQLHEMKRTNDLTQKALAGNDKSLRDTLARMDANIAQASRLAKAAEIANKTAITSDRPWIGGWIQVRDFEAGKSPSAVCAFLNSGRRPAILEDGNCRIAVDKWTTALAPDIRKPGKSILLPGQTSIAPIHFFSGGKLPMMDGDKMTSSLMAAFNAGEVHIKVIGTAIYRDIRTGERHKTTICMRYLPAAYGNPATFYECDSDYSAN